MISVEWCQPPHTDQSHHGGEIYTSLADIIRDVCRDFGVSHLELVSDKRARRVAWPRQFAMYRAYKETRLSTPAIGRHFGDRDHTTVLHAIRRVEERLQANKGGE